MIRSNLFSLKKILCYILCMCIIINFTYIAEAGDFTLTVDGEAIPISAQPYYIDNVLMLPANDIFSKMGFVITESESGNLINLNSNDGYTTIINNCDAFYFNGTLRTLKKTTVKSGSTYFVSSDLFGILDMTVDMNGSYINISTPPKIQTKFTQYQNIIWDLSSTKNYSNEESPRVYAIFEKEGQKYQIETLKRPNNIWRVSFIPPEAGEWRVNTICTDETNVDLHNIARTFDVQPHNLGKIFNVRDFGVLPNTSENCYDGIKAAIDAAIAYNGPSTVMFESGEYRIYSIGNDPTKVYNFVFRIDYARDLTIMGQGTDANGTKLIFTNPKAGGFYWASTTNILCKGFKVDYEPLPFTQGVIVGIDRTNLTYDLKIDQGYPELDQEYFAFANVRRGVPVHNIIGKGGTIFADFGDRRPYKIADRTWRLTVAGNWWDGTVDTKIFDNTGLAVGQKFYHMARNYGAIFAGMYAKNSAYDSIEINAGPSINFSILWPDGVLVVNCKVKVPDGSNRILSSNADGFHYDNGRNATMLLNSEFKETGDDSVNVHAAMVPVLEKLDNRTLITDHTARCYLPGDQIQMLDPSMGKIRFVRTVASNEKIISSGNEKLQGKHKNKITFDDDITDVVANTDTTKSDVICDMSTCSNPLLIYNNRFIRAGRGVLLHTVGATVENNYIEEPAFGVGILMTLGYSPWFEGPLGQNITIKGNTINRTSAFLSIPVQPAINISPVNKDNEGTDERVVNNVLIENNKFLNLSGIAVGLNCVKNAVIRNNEITRTDVDPYILNYSLLKINNCQETLIDNLNIIDTSAKMASLIYITNKTATGKDGVQIKKLEATHSVTTKPIIDKRPN